MQRLPWTAVTVSATWHALCSLPDMTHARTFGLNPALRFAVLFAVVFAADATEPSIDAAAPDSPMVAGRPATAVVTLTWPADAAPASVWVEPIADVDWGSAALGALTAEASGETVVYRQEIVVTAFEPGSYECPSVGFHYAMTPPEADAEGEDLPVSLALIALTAPPFPLEAASPSRSPGVFAGLALIVCAAAAVAFGLSWRRGRVVVEAAPALAAGDEALAGGAGDESDPFGGALLEARRCRAEGDAYGFYRALIDAVAADAGLVERLRRKAEDVGFRHMTPSPDELDGDLRDVERALARYKENDGA